MAKRRGPQKGLVAKMIALGYGFPEQKGGVLFFRVGAMARTNTLDWTDMLNTMAQIDYNEFDGRKVAEMLAFRANDGQLLLVEFGREYSPVVYIHFDLERVPDLAAGNERRVIAFLNEIRIEFGIVPSEWSWDTARQCLRLWWD